jgi:hypothetical protein
VALRAYDPDRHLWTLEILADLEIPVGLEESEEPDFALLMDTLNDEIITHVLIAVKDIACCLSN